jgi:transposase
LWLGTALDNSRDASKKGDMCHGEAQHLAKVTEADVKKIRELCERGQLSKHAIGAKFGIKYGAVWSIYRRINWKHVP